MYSWGAGCSLLPGASPDGRGYCDDLINLLISEVGAITNRLPLVANEFDGRELTRDHLEAIQYFWTSRFSYVIVFSPMPEEPAWRRTYLKTGLLAYQPDLELENRFFEVLDTTNWAIATIRTSSHVCGGWERCNEFAQTGSFMLTDNNHLSPMGAVVFGRSVASELGRAVDLLR